jgi:ABC-type dipeptide/oligopeptide/nickel transport system permease component
VLFMAFAFVVVNVLPDVVHAAIDPHIRLD